MASVPAYRRGVDSRSGGKIVRSRRGRRTTPYERPRLSNSSPRENPSWISRFIFSPSLTIASGAGKILSSVFVSESSSSSSDSDSEDDVENDVADSYNDVDEENLTFEETEGVKKNGMSKISNFFRKDCAPEKKETKRLIEQLLMQETFSRAERDKLFQIIESRVVECETAGNEADGRLTELSNRAVDTDNGRPAVRSTAIVEAKKWLNEKRLGSSSKLERDHGPCTLNTMMLPMVTDEDMGSPVDVAKSYMRARPPWASPSMNNFEFKSPSSLGLQLFKEESLHSINPLSSSKMRRDSPASGSWNIEEEIRRVRLKATEELLRNLPSSKLDWSSISSDYKSNLDSVRADNLKSPNEDETQNAIKSRDKSLTLFADDITTPNLPVPKITQDVSENGTCTLNTTSLILLQDKDLETNLTTDGKVANSSLDDRECSTVNEAGGLANGFPPPTFSLAQERSIEENHMNRTAEEKNSSGHEHEAAQGEVPVEEPCQLLSEASVDVPNIDENGIIQMEGNKTEKVVVEDDATDNVNKVEKLKASSQSSVAAGKANGGSGTPNLRRGRRRN